MYACSSSSNSTVKTNTKLSKCLYYMYMVNSEYTSSMSMKRRRGVNSPMYACLPNLKAMGKLKMSHSHAMGRHRTGFSLFIDSP